MLRRMYRRLFPRRQHPLLDQPMTYAGRDAELAAVYDAAIAREPDGGLPFIRERYREGIRWRSVVDTVLPQSSQPLRVLDVGSGNGAITLAFTATGRYASVGVDTLLSHVARTLPVASLAASAAALPFADDTFDALLCLEMLEHVDPDALTSIAHELARVLRPGGSMVITTPPRLRFLLRGDPHFGISGLLLLPASLQRRVAARRGFGGPHHYVGRIFWSASDVVRLFPGFTAEVLSRSRAPRRWAWDGILLTKRATRHT